MMKLRKDSLSGAMHFNQFVIKYLACISLLFSMCAHSSVEIESSIVRTKDSRMYHHAHLYYMHGDISKSEKYIDRAIRLNPSPHYKILKARIIFKRSAEELKDYVADSGRDILKKKEGLAIYAAALNELSQYEMAAKVYRVLTNKEPDNGRWWVGLGFSYENLDNAEWALKMYSLALKTANIPSNVYDFAQSRFKHINQLIGDID